MFRIPLRVVALLMALWAVAGCSAGKTDVNVMSFNIEWGGEHVSFENVIEGIRRSGADIVAIQEAEANLGRIANALGWFYDRRSYVISRFPIIDPPGANGLYVYVEIEPGKIVAVANVHLPSDPYGPDAVRDGAGPDEVLALERATRLPALLPYLAVLPELVANGIPVFFAGDFNAPAHTDWTEDTVGQRPFLRYSLEWPVSKAVAEAGFRDSWREIYPDPVKNPGLTWWAARPPLALYAPGENDARDRIDFVWFAGDASAVRSRLLGKTAEDEVDIGLDPWTSDHRAIVTEFLVTPAPAPAYVTTARRVYRYGDPVQVLYHGGGVALIQLEGMPDATVSGDGTLPVPAGLLGPGQHRVSYVATGKPPLARDFWVLDSEPARVAVAGSEFSVGQSIGFSWSNAPGNRNDYVAVYKPGVEASYEGGATWSYLGALPAGQRQLDASTAAWQWPVAPGRYVLRLIEDDGYRVLAESAEFVVRDASEVLDQPPALATVADGRLPIQALFESYRTLLAQGWQLDVISMSQPEGTDRALPIVALRSPQEGPAAWFLAGVHGEEPAGPNAIARGIESLAALGKRYPVVLLPLLNPQGYVRNWRYLNMPIYSEDVAGQSVGDSSHLLPDATNPGQARALASSKEADAITRYIVRMSERYPPVYSIDLHEDNLIDQGYVYSQGVHGADDELAHQAVAVLAANDIAIKMSGQSRFYEDIYDGIIGPVTDSSVDELMSSKTVILDGATVAGPAARTVLVFETPAANLSLTQRVEAHLGLIRSLEQLIGLE